LESHFTGTRIYVDPDGIKTWMGGDLQVPKMDRFEYEHRVEGPAVCCPHPFIHYSSIWWVDGEPVDGFELQ